MEFNTLVKTQLFPLLQNYGFEIAEELKNIVRFQSSAIKINIVFNDYDKSFFVEIGKKEGTLYPLNDKVIKELFNSPLSIGQVTPESFVKNISILFKTKEGNEILKGNIELFVKYKLAEIDEYNIALMQKQLLEVASRAWETKDYPAFVKSIDKIGISKVPQSYQLKYKIAKRKGEK